MYRELCEEYNYIGIGASGLTEECRWTKNKTLLKQMVAIANNYGTRVHGLGYQRIDNLNRNNMGFYSVDATSWIGSRFNTRYDIKAGNLVKSKAVQEGERLKDYLQLDAHNMKVFRKLQQLKDTE